MLLPRKSGLLWYLKLKHKHDTFYHAFTMVTVFTVIFEVKTRDMHKIYHALPR